MADLFNLLIVQCANLLMKNLILLSILIFSLNGYSQEGTIRVKKLEGCHFELITDTCLVDKTCKISAVFVEGINSSDTDEFSKILTYYPLLKEILVSKKTFENDLKDICDTKEYKLEKIVVKGKDPSNIYIDFFFKEK